MTPAHEIPIPMQQLLQHRAWVRRLARKLVMDEARADDLEQQTWLAALKRPPTGDTPKAWLGTVMRNLAARMRRSEVRVDRRERVAARPERLPPSADVVAEAEVHKRVVQAVLDLEPPYRETVLHRHYEGLPPREIAARMGVSVETVRSRVRRGLEQIRRRFDREHGGDGHTWRLALLPLLTGDGLAAGAASAKAAAGKAGSAAAGTGVLLMAMKSKITIAAVVLLLLAGGLFVALRDTEPTEPSSPEIAADGGDPATLNTKGEKKELEADAPPATTESDAPPPALAAGAAAVRVVRDVEGRDVSVRGATVRVVGALKAHAELETDVHGRATLPADLIGTQQTLWVASKDGALLRRDLAVAEGETLVRLAAARRAELRLVDENGNPLPPAEVKRRYEASGLKPAVSWVSATALDDPKRMLVNMFGERAGLVAPSGLRFEDDRVLLRNVPTEGMWRLFVDRPGAGPDMSGVVDASAASLVVTLPLPAIETIGVRVRVVTADEGRPLAGASVVPYFEIGDDAAFFAGSARRTDANGEVVLPKFDSGGRRYQRAPVWWLTTATHTERVSGSTLTQAKPGAIIERKAERNVTVEGKAYLRNGEPAVGARVMWNKKGYVRSTRVASDGTYRLEGIPYRKTVRVVLLEKLEMAGVRLERVAAKPGETSTFDFGQPRGTNPVGQLDVSFTHGGKPLPGIMIAARNPQKGSGKGQFGKTDAKGRYVFEGLTPGAYEVRWLLGDFRVSDDYGARSTTAVTITAGETRELVFDLPDGVVDVTIVDAETGKPMPGAAATIRPAEREHDGDRFEGFPLRLGWAEFTTPKGMAHLKALPRNTPLVLRCFAEGYEKGKVENVRAGSPDEPARVEVKLTKKR